SKPKQRDAYSRFEKDHERKLFILKFERKKFNEEIGRRQATGESYGDILEAIAVNKADQNKEDADWECSEFRKYMTGSKVECHAGPQDIETRIAEAVPSSVIHGRAKKSGRKTLFGYAATFGQYSVNLGGYRERIAPGAFTHCLKDCWAIFCLNHSPDLILGRTGKGAKSLRLYQDRTGLLFYCDLLKDDALSQSISARIARRDISKCSFSFTILKDRWSVQKNGETIRELLEIDQLFDTSCVAFPAYDSTSVHVEEKSADTLRAEHLEAEQGVRRIALEKYHNAQREIVGTRQWVAARLCKHKSDSLCRELAGVTRRLRMKGVAV
ncbi:hypothetical protein LCGC14_2252230, partial [marine sediment metagenome]